MVAAYSNKDESHVKSIKELIATYGIGGLIFMQGGPVRQANLCNQYQGISKVPLLISIDGEWGLAMRLDSVSKYPRQMTLGAIKNDSLIYKMGKQIANECKRLGIHNNFAPVADINNNPKNPVIGSRSFGENKFNVARKSYMYMAGMQDVGVMATGKHFPGHGDTDSDSHQTLPIIKHDKKRLDSLELFPFRYLIERGLGSMMIAHLYIPSLDSTKNQASTLSKKIVTKLLKEELKFKGLIFTDALNMKGVSKFYPPGVVDAKALLAGNDILLFSENVPKAIEEIRKALREGEITMQEIDEHCKKILKAKYWCGLQKKQKIKTRELIKDLNSTEQKELIKKLTNASVTLLQNKNNLLPLRQSDTSSKIGVITFGATEKNQFCTTLGNYFEFKKIDINGNPSKEKATKIMSEISTCTTLILQFNKSNFRADGSFGFENETIELIDKIASEKKCISILFTSPYLLNSFADTKKFSSILVCYENNDFCHRSGAEAIAGVNKIEGRLPVSSGNFIEGTGIDQLECPQIELANPEELGINKKKLQAIDSIALAGIKQQCYPGCQILGMKEGKIFYRKSFGNFTYEKGNETVTNETIYDLASLTKILSSSLAAMDLVSKGKLNIDLTIGDYLPETNQSEKGKIIIREMLAHQAGLAAWIPFYTETLEKNGNFKPGFYSREKSGEFQINVAEQLYLNINFRDTILKRILDSKLETKGQYVYSDLGYYFLQRIIEKLSGETIDYYVYKNFYQPMGFRYTGYLPLSKFEKKQIAPTENDKVFRKQIIQGTVHDQGAAMLGGVAGHAGLFSNATEVAFIMQMLLNGGELNGKRYLSSHVVEDFTIGCCYCQVSRRGLCFDKPEVAPGKKNLQVTDECSKESFGHSGFTGTFAWADPNNDLVFVFLSNRVYPDAEENKLSKSGIRMKIHKKFYEAINKTAPDISSERTF